MRKKRFFVNLGLLAFSVFIIAPLLGEGVFRAGIALKLETFRKPALYADHSSEGDYWKLAQDWVGHWRFASPDYVHSLLGWSQGSISADNPFGVSVATKTRMKSAAPKILFYGDSYVKGSASTAFQLPEYMSARLDGVEVVDLGVGGYGTDQMYLMFKETYRHIPGASLILLGILVPDDLNRALLPIRTSQKPYFLPDEAGNLQLKGVPIEKDQEKFFRDYSLSFKSYLFAFLKRKLMKSGGKEELKKHINARLLELFKTDAESAGKELVVVLFYSSGYLEYGAPHEDWLKDKLNSLDVPWIDTRDILLSYGKEKGLPPADFYDEGGHHHDLGNQVIAEGLLEYLRENRLVPASGIAQN